MLVAVLGVLAPVSVLAHHSFAAEFDAKKPLTLAGTFTRIEWTNPHAHIMLDVPGPGGVVTSWRVELGTPNDLLRGGWSKTSLKTGDRITVTGYAAKDGSHLVNGRSVTKSDGLLLYSRK